MTHFSVGRIITLVGFVAYDENRHHQQHLTIRENTYPTFFLQPREEHDEYGLDILVTSVKITHVHTNENGQFIYSGVIYPRSLNTLDLPAKLSCQSGSTPDDDQVALNATWTISGEPYEMIELFYAKQLLLDNRAVGNMIDDVLWPIRGIGRQLRILKDLKERK